MRRNQHTPQHLHHPVPRHPIPHHHPMPSIHRNPHQPLPRPHIHRQRLLLQQRRHIHMPILPMMPAPLHPLLMPIILIRINHPPPANQMILHQRLQALLPALRPKQKRIRPRSETPPRRVARREGCSSVREGGVFLELGAEPGALEREGERAECAGEEGEDFCDGGRREEEGVEGVDYALGSLALFGRIWGD